ncbi:gluconokinase [Paroceanicella profunda]|nr:gluconokinase [Paroceanicella profunda]
MSHFEPKRLVIVMGVSGCGKSTAGENLAEHLGGVFLDGDDFHPEANVEKMAHGIPLTDEDRWPWLDILGNEMASREGPVIVACSALRRVYRDRLRSAAGEPMCFVHLTASKEVIFSRVGHRKGHYMPASLVESQFATLEAPQADENVVTIDTEPPKDEVRATLLAAFPQG